MNAGPVFPPGFRFGASSAAYQIEGAVAEDGRGESIWDRFCRVPGAIAGGATGGVACDHFHRWPEDLDLIAQLRLEAYRFSLGWTRVQPDGRGALNRKGVDFYRRLAAGLRERGIDPVVTLYHADLPAGLQDAGGWAARDTCARFADFAGHAADELGDLVTHWITHNEPWGVAFSGHAEGTKAPGRRDWPTALQVAHHLLVSHGMAVDALRASRPEANVGISLNLALARPASSSTGDAEAARRQDGFVNRWFLDPLLRGAYPEDLLRWFEQRVGPFAVRAGDMRTIATPIDFLGINAYHPDRVRAALGREPLDLEHVPPTGGPTSPLGWRSTRMRCATCSPGSSATTGGGRSGSPRTASPTPLRRRSSSGSRTTRASATSPATSRRWRRRSPTAPTCGGTSSGRCWTASSGSSGTARRSASSTSTSRRSSAPSSAARTGIATSSHALAAGTGTNSAPREDSLRSRPFALAPMSSQLGRSRDCHDDARP